MELNNFGFSVPTLILHVIFQDYWRS